MPVSSFLLFSLLLEPFELLDEEVEGLESPKIFNEMIQITLI